MPAAIETERLTKCYGSHRGIEDVSFEVQPGEVFGFFGPNGAGKTTTIRALLDLIHPTSTARWASSRVATGRRSG
jgi:beta-exotoxin I transport system ATP-binding protein